MSRATETARLAISESACEWLVTLREGPSRARVRQRFASWLIESPVHVREYLAAEMTWTLIGELVHRPDFRCELDVDDTSDSTVVSRRNAIC